MPITKSAKKALRQTKRRTGPNLRRKETYKRELKRIRKLVLEKKLSEAEALIPRAYQALDKAVKIGVLKKNAASRRKSRITHLIQKSKHPA